MLTTWSVFFAILIVVFSIVMVATSPTAKETIIKQRFWGALGSQGSLQRADPGSNAALPLDARQPEEQLRLIVRNVRVLGFLRKLIAQSHVAISPKTLFRLIFAFACAVYAISWYFALSFPISSVLAAAAGALPIAYLYHRRKKWLAAFNAVLPECIDTFSRSLKAGQSIIGSLDIVGQQAPVPANTVFADVFKKQRYGLPLREGLNQMIDQVPSIDLKIMVTAILVQREAGGNLPYVLDRLSAVIRDRVRIRRDIRSQTAQGRLTGWVLGLLPPIVMLAINWISPNYSTAFFHDPMGRYMLYACVVLLLTGVFVIQRMVHGIEV
jgi:tight adherence protein B